MTTNHTHGDRTQAVPDARSGACAGGCCAASTATNAPDAGKHGRQATRTTRRAVLGTGAVGVAAALAACGSGGTSETTSNAGSASSGSASASGSAGTAGSDSSTGSATSTSGGAAASGPSIDVAGVEVGSGVVDSASMTVVTRPTETEWKAFDATCTHEGCLVTEVADGRIKCPCHGSYFDAATGDAVQGPAKEPLTAKSVSVSGDTATVS